ncbi:hypothetical protein [Heyndrickxia acidicola]|uniref:Uncharacterized protein n=1 Tax=Heyndrickxia acidicola TaxID=209389 RepID=A0ABU6MAJ3_9BACI|nr:hypothetical protein [Heyndrickxia acidicola]MED1201685.1 hypothetical protein [Heyndrickxia acidicola]
MLDVNVKTKDVRVKIPVPYLILEMGISLFSSKLLQRRLTIWTQMKMKDNPTVLLLPALNKKTLKPILKELKRHKGLTLVHITSKDGSEVKIKL